MPLPLVLGIVAGVAAVTGAGSGISGAVKLKDAKDTMELAKNIQKRALDKFERENKTTTEMMDSLGKTELEILGEFADFSKIMEKIQNKPEFEKFSKNGVEIPKYEETKIKEVSVGAGVLLGGIGGAAAGTAGGFAAAGATTSAVMALGTASTGVAISTLSGAAATNATLAALGGGAIAAGGGGIALGTTMLGVSTAGVGILVGGVIFNVVGSKLSNKADDAFAQAMKTEKEIDTICEYLSKLFTGAKDYKFSLLLVKDNYNKYMSRLDYIVNVMGKKDWNSFEEREKMIVQNTVLLVGMLYKMCKVELVRKGSDGNNVVNIKEIKDTQCEAETLVNDVLEDCA